jgi:hypothetical protein
MQQRGCRNDFDIRVISSFSFHSSGGGISEARVSHPLTVRAHLSGFAVFLLILFQFSIRQPQLARQSQEKLILCLLAFWKEGQQMANTLQEADRPGKGGWLG